LEKEYITMKTKHLLQIFVLLAVLFSTVGSAQSVLAQPDLQAPDPVVITRELTFWDATYTGYVDATRYEKWPFVFDATYEFTITVTPSSGDVVPLLVLMDSTGAEITSGPSPLSSTQPAGNYSVQVQPQSGSGFYELMIRQVDSQAQGAVSTEVTPTSVTVGDAAVVSVGLNEVPVEGYASAEFTCTYDPTLVSISNVVVTDLFGTDPATATFDPQDGNLIVAIAGSNGQKATVSGPAFTFTATSLAVGQATIACSARVSVGGDGLTDLPVASTILTINDVVSEGTLDGQVLASKTVTVNVYNPDTSLAATTTANVDGTFSVAVPAGSYTVEATASGHLSAEGPATVTAGNTTTMPTISLVAGDIDGNGVVDQYDALTIGINYNLTAPDAADLNSDGTINVLDLEILAANYRQTGPTAWQ
jgi:phage baseplate assembly protein gpV